MSIVQGIGGVFIESNDPTRLARWYEEVLGISMLANPDNGGYYHIFWSRDSETGVLRENPVFAINPAAEPLANGDRTFVLNLRVDDLDGMLAQLREKGVAVEERILVWERGKHAWMRDLDGNRIEIYEEILVDDDQIE